jgi:hypothetical protein
MIVLRSLLILTTHVVDGPPLRGDGAVRILFWNPTERALRHLRIVQNFRYAFKARIDHQSGTIGGIFPSLLEELLLIPVNGAVVLSLLSLHRGFPTAGDP